MENNNTFNQIGQFFSRVLLFSPAFSNKLLSKFLVDRIKTRKGLVAALSKIKENDLAILEIQVGIYQDRHSLKISEWEFGTSVCELPIADGNTVMKAAGHSGNKKIANSNKEFEFELYISETPSEADIKSTLSDITDFLSAGGGKIVSHGVPIRRSYYQKFVVSAAGNFLKKLVVNMVSGLKGIPMGQDVDAVSKLSEVLKRHQNIVIRAEGFIAIKSTVNRQSKVYIDILSERTVELLRQNPGLITAPDALMKEILKANQPAEIFAIGAKRASTEANQSPMTQKKTGTDV